MSVTGREALSLAAERLVLLGERGHPATLAGPGAGERVARALESGAAPEQALREAGATDEVARFFGAAQPTDLPQALASVAAAVGRSRERHAALRSAALYPVAVGVAALALAAVAWLQVLPAMSWLARAEHPVRSLEAPTLSLAVLALAVVTLGWVALALARRVPTAPFRAVRLEHERALVLSAASGAAEAGADLPKALAAAAGLSVAPELTADALALSAALSRGDPQGVGAVLLGPLGAALLGAAAAGGAGLPALRALAEAAEARAAASLPWAVLRAEAGAAVVGGLAVGAAAVTLLRAYLIAFGGS